jgi:hypothetical protein
MVAGATLTEIDICHSVVERRLYSSGKRKLFTPKYFEVTKISNV